MTSFYTTLQFILIKRDVLSGEPKWEDLMYFVWPHRTINKERPRENQEFGQQIISFEKKTKKIFHQHN